MGSFIPGQVATPAGDDDHVAPIPPRDVLLCVRTGKVRPFGGVKLRSAINKAARQGRIRVTATGLAGDEVHFEEHGGPEKALHHYDASHYATWNAEVPGRAHLFRVGGFGENLSTALLSETNVCIGDTFRVGPDVLIQVSGPRQPCFKLNHRFEYKKASSVAQNSGRTGWYYRVLRTGYIEEHDAFELVERINPRWSLSRVQKYLYHDIANTAAMAELVQLPGLGEEMVRIFRGRLAKGAEDFSGRLEGDRLPVVWRSYRVAETAYLTPRIKKFVLQVDGTSADIEESSFGRFPYVRLQFGPDLAFSRAYSVVSGDMRRFELGIARDDKSRGGSVYLHNQVQVGDVVRVAKGHGASSSETDCIDNRTDQGHIFVIGGIGITAFLSEIARLSQVSAANLEIHYAVRSRDEAAYLDHLPAKNTTVYAKAEGRRLDIDHVVPVYRRNGTSNPVVYCCGPSSLLSACQKRTKKLGYPSSHVYFEEFGGGATGTGDPFEVEIKSTGKVLQVPREKSLLQVLNEAGLEIESSCLVGNCGTCMVDHCKGDVEHRGTALEDEMKAESMLSCVSRGRGRIVIDC